MVTVTIAGPQGSGKTTLARCIRKLVQILRLSGLEIDVKIRTGAA